MSAEDQIPIWYQPTFTKNVQLLPQYKGKLMNFMDGDNYEGVQAEAVKTLGNADPVEDNERDGDTPNMDLTRDSAWVSPRKWHWGKRFDEKDDIRQLIDPSSKYVMAAAIGMGRYMDRQIIMPAFFGNRLAGKFESQRVVAFPADGNGQDVAVTVGSADGATAVGMSVAKLNRLRRLAVDNDIDLDIEQISIALSGQQVEDLFNDIKYTNNQWREQTVLDKNGKPTNYIGINIIECNGAGTVTAGVRCNPAWTTMGMHIGRWQEMQTRIGENPQKQYKKQVYIWQQAGCTRADEKRVFKVYNKEI